MKPPTKLESFAVSEKGYCLSIAILRYFLLEEKIKQVMAVEQISQIV